MKKSTPESRARWAAQQQARLVLTRADPAAYAQYLAKARAYYHANEGARRAAARAMRPPPPTAEERRQRKMSRAKTYQREQRTQRHGNPSEWTKFLVYGARKRARALGLPCTIQVSDLEPFPTTCPVLGIPLVYGNAQRPIPGSASLDRIDPAQGYVPGNVAVMSRRANTLKANATLGELLAVLHDMLTQREERAS